MNKKKVICLSHLKNEQVYLAIEGTKIYKEVLLTWSSHLLLSANLAIQNISSATDTLQWIF